MGLYLPGPANLVAVLVTWAIGALLLMGGTALTRDRPAAEFRIAAGWGALCLVLTGWGVFLPVSLRMPLCGVILAVLAVQLLPRRRPSFADWAALGKMLVLTLPLWAVMAPVRPSQVDTFLNLLPNADYLVDYARLPTASLPPSYSFLPAAPYDTQFLAFLGSLVQRAYPAQGMSLVNIMLQLLAGLAIARVLAGCEPGRVPSWRALALGMLLATFLNPGFVPRIDFSSYGETGLAVTALLSACLFIEAQAARGAGARPPFRVELSLILAAMINIKQSGIGLVLALVAAAIVLGAAERRGRVFALCGEVAVTLVPAALLYGVWRYFVAHAGVAELEPLPFAAWNWRLLPATAASIAGAIAEKPVYFVAVAVAFACFWLLLRRQGWSPTTRLLGFTVATFVFYNGFLLVTYLAHFTPEMSAEAHSYFRYSTHLALLLTLGVALAVRDLAPELWTRPRLRRTLGGAAVALAVLGPVLLTERLRFDIEMPQPLVWDLARDLKPYLADGDRLALLMPGDDDGVGDLLRGYLASAPPRRRGLVIDERDTVDAATLDAVAAAGYGLAVISCTPPDLDALPPGEAALLRHDADGWHEIAAWPYSAGIALSPWQHTRSWPALCR